MRIWHFSTRKVLTLISIEKKLVKSVDLCYNISIMSEMLYTVETREEAIDRVAHDAGRIAVGETVALHLKTIESRDYQIDTWAAIDQARAEGKDSALAHLATGLGKTTVGVIDSLKFIHEERERTGKTPRILFACHQNYILEQAALRYKEFAPALSQGWYGDGKKELGNELTFATMQSLYSNLEDIDPEEFDYIIFDEAHHTQAETFREVVEHFNPAFKLALTATPDRLDEERIEELFGEPVYSKPLSEAMLEGYLADVDYHIVLDAAVKQAMQSGFNPKTLKEITDLLRNESPNKAIVEQIKEEMERIGLENAKTIVFCSSITQADEIAELLGGQAYHSSIEKEERKKIMEGFKSNGIQVITTRDMFNEGVDVPDARLLVFLRSTSSRTIFEQQLGRGLRKHEGKDAVSVLDFVANIERLSQVKELLDSVTDYQARLKEGGLGTEFDDPEAIEDIAGLKVTVGHSGFDFDKISVDLLDRMAGIRNRIESGSLSDEELIELALTHSKEAPLDVKGITELNHAGSFVSARAIRTRFGSIPDFQRACGFEVSITAGEMSNEDIINLALEISPDKPLRTKDLNDLAEQGVYFPNRVTILDRFGGLTKFHQACGFDPQKGANATELLDLSNDELIDLADTLSPGAKIGSSRIKELSKQKAFVSEATIVKRFGSLREFHKARGFETEDRKGVRAGLSNDELIEMAKSISPEKPLTSPEIAKLGKEGRFVSVTTVQKKFGSMREFQKACGF
jgi:superfamily II DNA or RNA helicase